MSNNRNSEKLAISNYKQNLQGITYKPASKLKKAKVELVKKSVVKLESTNLMY